MASTAAVASPHLVATVSLAANLNTELDAACDEIHELRGQLAMAQRTIQSLEHQMGQPSVRTPEFRAESLPRKRFHYGAAEARTIVED